MMSVLERRLLWLVAIRVLVVATMAGTYTLTVVGKEGAGWSDPIRWTVAWVSVATLVYLALYRLLNGRYVVLQAYVQFIGDVVAISQFIHGLGGDGRRFTILYLLVIIAAVVLLRRSAGLVVASVAFVAFGLPLLAGRYPLLSWLASSGAPMSTPELIYDLAVHLVGFYGIAVLTSYLGRDITRVEKALAERDADLAELQVQYRDVVRSITSGLVTTDLGGVVTSINRAGEEILGASAADLVGRSLAATGLLEIADLQSKVPDSSAGRPERRSERTITRRGVIVPVGYSVTQLRDGDGAPRGLIVIFQDLTELSKLQERLRLQDRMAAVGMMAAGLAHEVGNPLAAISGSTQMLAAASGGDSSQRKLLEIVLRESQRLDRTVKGFLQFARPRPRAQRRFDIGLLLEEQVALLTNSAEVDRDHQIALRLATPHTEVSADPDQISQVFWNLVRNAIKAMPDGGLLTILGQQHEDRYAVAVQDTGTGMGEEERANLFHPFKSFFDDGSGIGMAIVYRIVEEHGGDIKVDSTPGEGTIVTVSIPMIAPETMAREENEL